MTNEECNTISTEICQRRRDKIYLTYESIYVINWYTVKIEVDQKIHTEF